MKEWKASITSVSNGMTVLLYTLHMTTLDALPGVACISPFARSGRVTYGSAVSDSFLCSRPRHPSNIIVPGFLSPNLFNVMKLAFGKKRYTLSTRNWYLEQIILWVSLILTQFYNMPNRRYTSSERHLFFWMAAVFQLAFWDWMNLCLCLCSWNNYQRIFLTRNVRLLLHQFIISE